MAGNGSNTASSSPASIPLIGRDREVGILSRALEEVADGRGRLVLIIGDAGMGKTTLCRKLTEEASARGMGVAQGSTWEAVDAPAFWPWIQVLRQLEPEGGDLFDAYEKRFELFESVASLLSDKSKERPLVVILEDLHAADESTLVLLRFLHRSLTTSPILWVGTYDEREASEPGRPGSPLADLAGEAGVIELTPLDERAVAAVCEDISRESLTESLTASIYAATEGNPLFVSEAVRVLTARGNLHRPDYSIGFRVPRGLKGMIRRRLEALPKDVVAILSIASVLGRHFDVSLLQEVAEAHLDPLLDLLDQAAAAGVIEESSALGRYAFAHIMIRESLYEELTSARRMRLHRMAAEVLESAYGDDLDARLPELAHHWFKAAQAGDPDKAMEFARRAAAAAEHRGASEEAVRLYKRALKVAQSTGRAHSEIEELRAAVARAGEKTESIPLGSLDTEESRFKKEGEYWTIAYEGTVAHLKDTKGLRYIHLLLSHPGREMHALELIHLDSGGSSAQPSSREDELRTGSEDAGSVLDATAKARYKARLDELREDIDEAKTFNDPERSARAQEEIEALTAELARALGMGGRDRKVASEAERARVSVQKAIKDSLKKLGSSLPSLREHLVATIHTGTFCRYAPDPRSATDWQLR